MFVLVFLLVFAGQFLIVADPLVKADAILVIGGDHKPERARRVSQLWRTEYAPLVIVSAGTLVQEGNDWMPEAQVMLRQLIEVRVPKEVILIEQESQTTVENAQYSLSILRERNIQKILLVTSPHQSSRAKKIFEDLYGTEILVDVQPALESSFCSLCWLWQRDQIQVVLSEYWKWGVYLVAHR